MSRIDDLIQDLCPEGVPFQALGTLGRRNKGTSMTAARMREIDTGGPIRVFAGGNTVADVDETSVPVKAVVREPSVIVKSRGHIGFTYYAGPFSHKSELWSYSLSDPIVNQKFVYYYLLTRTPNLQDLARATSVKLPQLSVRDTDALKVPVPPLEVQGEIVRILDTFSALEAELEAELEARRTQYEHYREALLRPAAPTDTSWVTLDRIAENYDAKRKPIAKGKRVPGHIPYYGASGVVDYVQDYLFDGDYLLVSEDGANLKLRSTPIAFSVGGHTWVNNHAHVLRFDNPAEQRFVEHYLNATDLTPFISGAAQPKLNKANLNRIPIPWPSGEEVRRIATSLDRMESLTSDLAFGLPAEIEARRKQYEYYRDRLLTFEETLA